MFSLLTNFLNDESGNYTVELSLLFPVIVLIAMYIMDTNLYYDGLIMTATSANEALRYAIVAKDENEAKNIVESTLGERFQQSKLGWCESSGAANCKHYKDAISFTNSKSTFESNDRKNLLIKVDGNKICNGDKWVNGNYLVLGVRTHKSSLLPSFSTFRRLITQGGSIYHDYTYVFTARIESNKQCE